MSIYALLVLIVIAAIPLTVWLKREGDRSWRAHRQDVLTQPMREAFLRVQIALVDHATPKFTELGKAAARAAAAVERLGVAMKEGDR